jgi:hypothetical protein
MVARLGWVIFWAACAIALLFFAGAYQDWVYHVGQTITYGNGSIFAVMGVIVLLVGWAIKYVLSG